MGRKKRDAPSAKSSLKSDPPQLPDVVHHGDLEPEPNEEYFLPRQRRAAQMAAQGRKNCEIAKELDYSEPHVSKLMHNPKFQAEVTRIRNALFEENIASRLKRLAEPAMNIIERCLTDRTNRFKASEQLDTAKWAAEMNAGKATQKHDVGENILGIMLDKLDSMKDAGRALPIIDVTSSPISPDPGGPENSDVPRTKTEEDMLRDWVIEHD